MKIIILSQFFHPEIGAPQNRLLELARIFNIKGWEVSVITSMPNYPTGKIFPAFRGKFKLKENLDSINILRYWMYASNAKGTVIRIFSMLTFSFTCLFSYAFLKKLKPDFFFVESPPLSLALSGYVLSKLCKSKLIMNVSDIWPLTAKELGAINDGVFYKRIESIEKFLYKKAFLCTGQSEEIVEHLKRKGGKKVYLFRNGVDVQRFTHVAKEFMKQDLIKIIYTGLIGVAQGIFEIAKNINFKELAAEFHIYGDGAEKEALSSFLIRNPERNIFLHEPVNREEIPDLIGKFYCTIIPLVKNIYGAVPSKIYEAMACGLPILFSGSGEGARIIIGYDVGLTSRPGDFEELKKNILTIKNSVELRNRMSLNGRKISAEKFDRNKIIEKFSNKLLSIAEGR